MSADRRPVPAPPSSVRLDSPLIPAEIVAERVRLAQRMLDLPASVRLSDQGNPRNELVITGVLASVGLLLTMTVGGAPWAVLALISGSFFVLAALQSMTASSIRNTKRRLVEIAEEYTFSAPGAGEGRDLIEQALGDLATLPAHLRAECVPMLDTIRATGEALVECPDDERLLQVLRHRAALIGSVRREWEGLQADLRVARTQDTIGPAWDDDTDMEAARQVAQALAAVRAEQGTPRLT